MAAKNLTSKRRAPDRSSARRTDPLDRFVNVADFERAARRRLAGPVFDYYAGGAEDERTLERNRASFDRFVFLPRVLVDVSRVHTATTVLGTPVATPILLAPTAYQRLGHREGETATARAAGAAGSLMVASTMATRSLEEIAAAASGPLWFQLYASPDRSLTERLVSRAEKAGYRALVVTVDTPRLGRRERDLRTNFGSSQISINVRLPAGLQRANLAGEEGRTTRWQSLPGRASAANDLLDPSLTWDAVKWLRGLTSLPLILKGIMRAADAQVAVDMGVAGVWVSNHGGRQLDAGQGTILALPAVAEAVAGRAEVYVDGGIRRGTDVLKALALGARAAFIGRPFLWGLAVGGESGVKRVLDLLKHELETSMALAGVNDVTNVDRSLVVAASD